MLLPGALFTHLAQLMKSGAGSSAWSRIALGLARLELPDCLQFQEGLDLDVQLTMEFSAIAFDWHLNLTFVRRTPCLVPETLSATR